MLLCTVLLYLRTPPPATLDNVLPGSDINGVSVIRNGNNIPVKLKMKLKNGDEIVTDNNSIAIIRLVNTLIVLDKSSRITIIDYNENIYNHIGRIFVDVNHYFQVKTEYITAGVGGTKFQLSVTRDNIVTIDVIEGFIILKSNNETWEDIYISNYYTCQANGKNAPSQPVFTPVRTSIIKIWLDKIEKNIQPTQDNKLVEEATITTSKTKIDIESQIKTVLQTVAKTQELYRLDRDIYADNINKLTNLDKNKNIFLVVLHADRTSFIVAAYFENSGKYWTIDQNTTITVHEGRLPKDK